MLAFSRTAVDVPCYDNDDEARRSTFRFMLLPQKENFSPGSDNRENIRPFEVGNADWANNCRRLQPFLWRLDAVANHETEIIDGPQS